MPEHVHLLVYINNTDRTLEKVRSVGIKQSLITVPERTLSSVRSNSKNDVRSDKMKQYSISDLMQSIKGNFSRKIHIGNIWQKRFYTRIVNNRRYLHSVIEYIKHNPTKAELPLKYYRQPYRYFNWTKINFLF